MLQLNQRDRDRLVVLHQTRSGGIGRADAAARLGLSSRQFRRLLRRFEEEGDRAVGHRGRGRAPNNALDLVLRDRVLAKAREPLYRDFGPTLLSEHLARDPEIGVVSPYTLRRWMIDAGLWQVRHRRARHRKRRERRAAFGELVLMDTSIHAWLEDRSAEPIVLIALMDDATNRLRARFFPRDTGTANRMMIVDWLEAHGRMGALYTDRASHFVAHFRASEREARDKSPALTVIRRALDALEVEMILALSPQAKGRVERLFGTLQDRLVKELRVAGIGDMENANAYLEERFIPFWDARFAVEAREPGDDAHRTLPEASDLLRLFAETQERVLRADYTFRFRNVYYQVEASDAATIHPGQRITLEHRIDDTTHYRCGEKYLIPVALHGDPVRSRPAPEPEAQQQKPVLPRRPPADHPWRRQRTLTATAPR